MSEDAQGPPSYLWRVLEGRRVVTLDGPQSRPAMRRRSREIPLAALPESLRRCVEDQGADDDGDAATLRVGRRTLLVVHHGARSGLLIDLSLQQRRSERLTAYAKQLEEGIDALPEAFVLYDAQDRLLIANPRYAELYPTIANIVRPGVSFEEIVRTSVARGQFRFDEEPAQWLERRIAFHREGIGFFEQCLDDGRWIQLSERRTRSGGIASIRADITLLKEREKALRRAKQAAESTSKSMSRFLAVFSHEVRNGLNGMVGAAQMLAFDARNAGQRQEAQLLFESTGRLTRVLSDLLDYLKNEATGVRIHLQAMDPRHLVDAVCVEFESLATQRGLVLLAAMSPNLPASVLGDPGRIQQVLANLVSNAIKYSDHGTISVGLRIADGRLRYFVSDEGIGIDEADLGGLFEFFSRTAPDNPRSTGLGLAISKQLVMAMGGVVGVQSSPGQGSQFWFDLAIEAPPTALGTARGTGALPTSNGPAPKPHRVPLTQLSLTVGVLDDDPLSRFVAQDFLRRLGHTPVVCSDGDDVQRQVLDRGLDALLLDLMMPGESGVDVARRLRAQADPRFARLAIVVVTGNLVPDSLEACQAAGTDAVVQKPLFIGSLDQVLRLAMASRTPATRAATPALFGGSNDGFEDDPVATLRRLRADIGVPRLRQSVESSLQLFEDLRRGLARPPDEALAQLLHRVQGTGPQLGFHSLRELAREVESHGAARSLQPTRSEVVDRLERALEQAFEILKAELDELVPDAKGRPKRKVK